MTQEHEGPHRFYAYRLDDGDTEPLTILAAVQKTENGVAWGYGYSTLVPRGEYGTFPQEALTRELPADVFNIFLQLVRSAEPEHAKILAICSESLPLLHMAAA